LGGGFEIFIVPGNDDILGTTLQQRDVIGNQKFPPLFFSFSFM
jgi:hypothetical protein